jgi:anti-sigma factor RsiW
MHCEDVRELLGNYIDQELTETMRRRIETHLMGCLVCAGDLATLKETVGRLRAAPAPEAPNSWHFERLLDRLARDHDTLIAATHTPARPVSQLSLNITAEEES